MKLKIRTARPDDTGPIPMLLYDSGPEIYDFAFGKQALDRLAYEFASGVGFAGYCNLTVAVLDGDVVGTASFFDRDAYFKSILTACRLNIEFFGFIKGMLAVWRCRHMSSLMPIPEPGELYLANFSIAASHRGQGIGSQLLNAKLAEARRFGYTRFGLEVSVSNPRAEALYARLGMQTVAETAFSVPNAGVAPVRRMTMKL